MWSSGHPSRPGQLPPKPKPVSSVPAGTPLKGVRIIKGVEDPVAKEDSEYPEWLWSLADEDMGVGRTDSPIRAMRRQLNKQNTDAIRCVHRILELPAPGVELMRELDAAQRGELPQGQAKVNASTDWKKRDGHASMPSYWYNAKKYPHALPFPSTV